MLYSGGGSMTKQELALTATDDLVTELMNRCDCFVIGYEKPGEQGQFWWKGPRWKINGMLEYIGELVDDAEVDV